MVKLCLEGFWVLQWLYGWALGYGQAQVLKGKPVHQKIPQKIPDLKIYRRKICNFSLLKSFSEICSLSKGR